ncbi:MAG: hypothetical protein WBO92_04275 [Candidatus Moraniibacteriota bacterium]
MTTETASLQASTLFQKSRTVVLYVGLGLQLVMVGAVAYFIRPSSDAFILRYNAFFGVDILGAWWQAYLIPGMCLVFFLGNLTLAEVLIRRQAALAALILVYGALLVVISETVAMAALISINS